MTVCFANTEKEIQKILDLRYRILRKPWNQSIESATDDLEKDSFNAYIKNEHGDIMACGRLQINSPDVGQIRFMAVDDAYQGKGCGKLILQSLEKKAKEIGLSEVELQARENAVNFYKNNGYVIVEESFKLWGIIQHYLMKKRL